MVISDFITTFLAGHGLSDAIAGLLGLAAVLALLALAAYGSYWAANRYLVRLLEIATRRSRNTWDDTLVRYGFVRRLSYLVPIIIVYISVDLVLPIGEESGELVKRLAMVFLVMAGIRMLDSLLQAVREILGAAETAGGRPIRGYTDAAKIIIYLLGAIFIISILTGKSPWGVLSILGGFTVVLMLVFKDTILGFVASLQLSGHDMVRVGDWIEMPRYGADGDVVDVTIHTVKVRNWDKTISTIPTYSLVSDAFKNWRGMTESGGRRIKRSLYIDMNSVRFCTDEMLARFGKYRLVADYIQQKQDEIEAYNRERDVDTGVLINGRRQTNLGIFRAYITAYLRRHPRIHQEMTFLVRHLEPTPEGLPIQIYVFSREQAWAHYEAIQADIFDHLLAAVPHFDLRIFQKPAGTDFRNWRQPA